MAARQGSLKKEASLLTLSKTVSLLITIVTAMLLSRFRSLEEYGTFSQLALVLNLLITLCLLGIPNAINYFLPRVDNEWEKQDFLNTFFTLNTILSVVAGIVMVASMPILVRYFKNHRLYEFYYFAIIMPWAKITIQERGNLLIASRKTKTLTIYMFLNSLCLLGIILFTQIIHQNFQFYMRLYVVVEMVFALLVYWEVHKLSGKFRFHINKELCRQILVFSVPIGLSDMVSTITREVDKLMIGGFLDIESLAIYTNAAREIPLTVISTSVIAVLMPKLSKMVKDKKIEEAVDMWKNTISLTYIFMCFGVAVLITFAPQVMTILYSPKYLPGTGVFRIYSLILLWRTTYFGTMLSLHGETKKILLCSISSMLLNIALNYVLFKILGFTGPAWSTFLAIGIMNMFQLRFSAKITGIPISKLFPWFDLLKITVINFVCGLAIFLGMKAFGISTDTKGCFIAVVIGALWLAFYMGVIMRKRLKRQWRNS